MQGGKDSEAIGLKGTEYSSQSVKNALDSGETENPKAKGIDTVSVLWTFGKCLGALLPVYLAGYYRVSTSLLVFGLMVYTGWKHSREAKESRLRSAIQSLHDEQEYTSMKVFKNKQDLPSWVRITPNDYWEMVQTRKHQTPVTALSSNQYFKWPT